MEKNNLGALPFPILENSTIDTYPVWLESAQTTGALAIINKPLHRTSFDIVAKLRWLTKTKKVGHTGTLDPLATGVLILCFGKATKWIDQIQSGEKEYLAHIKLGATTITDDAEGEEIVSGVSIDHIAEELIDRTVQTFTGTIAQIPPMYSAIKKNGVPLYKLARKGETINRTERMVAIQSIQLCDWKSPVFSCLVRCGKGTYIRALARDIGSTLECGGYLTGLQRTENASFRVERALDMDTIIATAEMFRTL